MGKDYQIHEFRCINCGKAGIPLARRSGHQHSKFHRKKLYCIHCKTEINHVEIKNEEELYDFLNDWEDGVYYEEAQNSLVACGIAR